MRAIDSDNDGLVNLSDFMAAFHSTEDQQQQDVSTGGLYTVDLSASSIEAREMEELHSADAVKDMGTMAALVDIPDEIIRHVQVRGERETRCLSSRFCCNCCQRPTPFALCLCCCKARVIAQT